MDTREIKKMMIVDDEDALTFSLYQSFIHAQQNYEVVTAASGEEARFKLTQSDFDLVITDITMPGISGLDLLTEIKNGTPDTEVIIMTAYGSDEKREEAMSRGARYYIEKPFDLKELKELVISILQ